MRIHKLVSGLLFVFCLAFAVDVSAKPNFSGKWELDMSKSTGVSMVDGWTLVVKHRRRKRKKGLTFKLKWVFLRRIIASTHQHRAVQAATRDFSPSRS